MDWQAAWSVHVPLPTFFSEEQLRHALHTSGAQLLVTSAAAPPPGPAGSPAPPLPGIDAKGWKLDPGTGGMLPEGTACVTYTSGSTGRPRGVCLSAEIALPSLQEIGYTGASGLDVPALLRCLHRYQPESIILVPQLLLALVMAAEHGAALPASLRYLVHCQRGCRRAWCLGEAWHVCPARRPGGACGMASVHRSLTCGWREDVNRTNVLKSPFDHLQSVASMASTVRPMAPVAIHPIFGTEFHRMEKCQTVYKPGSVPQAVTIIPLDHPLPSGSRDLPGRPGQ